MTEFSLSLPPGFQSDDVFGLFGRDADGRTERVEGDRLTKAMLLVEHPARVVLEFTDGQVRVVVEAQAPPTAAMVAEARAKVVRMLGLGQDPEPFEQHVLRSKALAPLLSARRGLRIPQTVNVYEGLVWVIVGQQMNLRFAGLCRSRMIALCGRSAGEGFIAHPTPAEVAALDYADLVELQFSRRKAEYLIDTSRLIATGELDLEGLRARTDEEIMEHLTLVRGLGPWSINYLLLRSLGREDRVPVGDAGLVLALQRFFQLDERPDAQLTLQLMEAFAPYRSLASFHLWKSLESP